MYIGEEAPEMLSFKMRYGSRSGLHDPSSVMLSSSTAKALFGNEDPIGRIVQVNNNAAVKVTGVYEDFPKNTEFYGTDFIRPWSNSDSNDAWREQQGWDNHFLWIYVQLQPNVTFEQAGKSVRDAEKRVVGGMAYMQDELKYNPEIRLLPMKDWHLRSDFKEKEGKAQSGPVQMVWFIGAIGVFILVLACINFMNLSTARSERRAKEVGIRKTIGSIRHQLIGQFLSESLLVVILAFLMSLVLVKLTLPWFNELAGKDMHIPWGLRPFWIGTFLFVVITGLLAGSYPALFLSSFKPVSVLKGTIRLGGLASLPRKALVVVQFTISVALIISTSIIYNELMYVKDRPIGYDRHGLIMVNKKSDEYTTRFEALRTQLLNSAVVSSVAESGGEITSVWSGNGGFNWEGKDPNFEAEFATLNVSAGFGKTVGWEFIDGRDLSPDIASDSAGFVLNEAAVRYMGIKDPVGKTMRWTNRAWGVDQDFRIVGVIKDMLMDSPFEPVKPTIYFTLGGKGVILVRIDPLVSANKALPKIESVFKAIIPDMPFEYKFVDDAYAAKFEMGNRIGRLALVFTIFAIVISCLGLFGLASFVAERRTKEVGIRKVLGASVGGMWRLISGEFVWLVCISCLVAVPVTWYLMDKALNQFTYRVTISIWLFIMAVAAAIVITLLTVGYQAIRAATANPVKSLRSE